MFMTNNLSIQDVLFFPQMRPEAKKADLNSSPEEYHAIGVPEPWVDVLIKMGYNRVEKLAEVEKHTKLHQDLCGYNKKNKLGLTNPAQEEVKNWLDNAGTNTEQV